MSQCSCGHNHSIQVNASKSPEPMALRLDPTRTTTLRQKMLADVTRRFKALVQEINKIVVDEDCFGLAQTSHQLQFNAENQFKFARSADKVKGFMDWLQEMEKQKILTVVTKPGRIGNAVDEAWVDVYIDSAYQQGIRRAGQEMKKGGMDIPIPAGMPGRDPVALAFSSPTHADRVGLIYTRVFNELKGITNAMDQQISSILAQGLAEGRNPQQIASLIKGRVEGMILAKARTLARTEIVRAHHMASIQEYRNAGLVGVRVKSEWLTAGFNVCPVCSALQGKIFTLDQIEGMIPRHPNCLLDGQIPIYTMNGWKPIRDIKVGDMVLTHKGRFRKVLQLHRNHTEVGQECIRFGTKNWSGDWTRVSVTGNHPIQTERGWIAASELKETDILSVLSGNCKQCGKKVPWGAPFCSRSCNSKHTATEQWKSDAHRKNIQQKNKVSMIHQYETGVRDRFAVTEEANKATRKSVLSGTHPLQDPENHRKANQRLGEIHNTGGTWIEKKLFWALEQLGLSPVIGFSIPIRRRGLRKTYLFPDFAFPDHGVLVEADGIAWHDVDKDAIRDEKLNLRGWDVLRFAEADIHENVMKCAWQVKRYLLNHSGSYEFLSIPLTRLEKWQTKRRQPTFNLSVEEDESYLAWGWIVHNCRCTALPYMEGISPKPKKGN